MTSNLSIPKTARSPAVDFRYDTHRLALKGESWPEDAQVFYSPIRESLQAYLDGLTGSATVSIDIELIYINSSSAPIILSLLELLDRCGARGNHIQINWYFLEDDEQMRMTGELYAEDLRHVDFRLCDQPDSDL